MIMGCYNNWEGNNVLKVVDLGGGGQETEIEVRKDSGTVSVCKVGWNSIALGTDQCAVELRNLSLANLGLKSLDLSSLGVCIRLESLTLNSNQLTFLDLSPLKACRELQKLWLHNNKLSSLDLEPIRNCVKLRSLYLDSNHFNTQNSLTLDALQDHRQLRSLRLGGNTFGGVLDVSGLASCVSLTSLDIGSNVRLIVACDISANSLAPGLRRRSSQLEWVKEKKNGGESGKLKVQSQVSDQQAVVVKSSAVGNGSVAERKSREEKELHAEQKVGSCLILGFQTNSSSSFESMLSPHLEVRTVRTANGNSGASLGLKATAWDVIVADASMWNSVQDIHAVIAGHPPVVMVVQKVEDVLDSAENLKYNSATAVMCAPLDTYAAECIANIASLQREEARQIAISHGNALENVDTQSRAIDFESVRQKCIANGWILRDSVMKLNGHHPEPKNNVSNKGVPMISSLEERAASEESVVRMWFRRRGGRCTLVHFPLLTSLIGLPKCAHKMLAVLVMKFAGTEILSSETPLNSLAFTGDITDVQFLNFWKLYLRPYDAEHRLFIILSNWTQLRYANASARQLNRVVLGSILELLCATAGVYSLNTKDSSVVGHMESSRELIVTAVAMMMFSINPIGCTSSQVHLLPVSMHSVISSRLSSNLRGTESGSFEGLLHWLRKTELQTVSQELNEFFSRGPEFKVKDPLAIATCFEERRLLHSEATRRVFYRLAGSRKSTSVDVLRFVCVLLSSYESSTDASAEFWFHVLDHDADGKINVLDLSVWWDMKQVFWTSENRGNMPTLEWFCIWLRDALRSSEVTPTKATLNKTNEKLGRLMELEVSKKQFLQISQADREFVLRCLLFCDDDLETMETNASLVPVQNAASAVNQPTISCRPLSSAPLTSGTRSSMET